MTKKAKLTPKQAISRQSSQESSRYRVMAKPKLTVKEAKLVKAKAEGKTTLEAANEAGYLPNANDETKRVEATRTLQKPHVKAALDIALKKYGIDIESAIAPIGKALRATKVQITGQGDQAFAEVVEDIELQLKGSDRALKLMGIGQNKEPSTTNFIQVINEKGSKYNV